MRFLGPCLAVGLALAVGGCGLFGVGSGPMKAFRAFERAKGLGNCSELRALVLPGSQAATWVEDYCTPAGGMTVYGQSIPGKSAADLAADMGPSAMSRRSKMEVESKDRQDDDSVLLAVLEKDLSRSNFSRPAPPRRYKLRLKEEGGAWKLAEYGYEDLAE